MCKTSLDSSMLIAVRGPCSNQVQPCAQVYDLEKAGGSIVAGVIKMMQEKKRNPAPPRDPRLPPKPQGQTVGSFRDGLQTLPIAIAERLGDRIRSVMPT